MNDSSSNDEDATQLSREDGEGLHLISRRLFHRAPTIDEYIINDNQSSLSTGVIFTNECLRTSGKHPYPWQVQVGVNIIENTSIHQLLVRPTGGGKSMVYLISGILLKGVTLCISPLLSLGADQVNKLRELPRHGRDIFAYHLDEMTPSSINYLASGLHQLHHSNTVFLFASPQLLTEQQKGQRLLQSLFDLNLIRLIVFDEIHLVVGHGLSFRKPFLDVRMFVLSKLKYPFRLE